MKRAILFIAFLMQPARTASSQVASHHPNRAVDKGHNTALAGTPASVEPRQIQLPIIDGADIRFARVSTAAGTD